MAMANHPEVQQAAWKELDALLGDSPSRLPCDKDKPQLPFIAAITKEVLRWHVSDHILILPRNFHLTRQQNVVPLGVPHILTEDDEYKGQFLRKGTIVLGNIWLVHPEYQLAILHSSLYVCRGVLHDPKLYPDPLEFNPWRWLIDTPEGLKLNPSMPSPIAAFGFGRR
jgi:cytochrome P450